MGRWELGRWELGRWELGRWELGRWELGRWELGRWELGRKRQVWEELHRNYELQTSQAGFVAETAGSLGIEVEDITN